MDGDKMKKSLLSCYCYFVDHLLSTRAWDKFPHTTQAGFRDRLYREKHTSRDQQEETRGLHLPRIPWIGMLGLKMEESNYLPLGDLGDPWEFLAATNPPTGAQDLLVP